jgi:hypothetical protein
VDAIIKSTENIVGKEVLVKGWCRTGTHFTRFTGTKVQTLTLHVRQCVTRRPSPLSS